MRNFQGKTRQFTVELTIGAAKRVRSRLNVDLMKPTSLIDGLALFSVLYTDIALFVDVLYVLCDPDETLSGEEFANELPATWIACRDAFFEEWVDFFHRNGLRDQKTQLVKGLEAVVAGLTVTEERLMQIDMAGKARDAVNKLNFDELIDRHLNSTPGSKSIDSPESSDSYQTN